MKLVCISTFCSHSATKEIYNLTGIYYDGENNNKMSSLLSLATRLGYSALQMQQSLSHERQKQVESFADAVWFLVVVVGFMRVSPIRRKLFHLELSYSFVFFCMVFCSVLALIQLDRRG